MQCPYYNKFDLLLIIMTICNRFLPSITPDGLCQYFFFIIEPQHDKTNKMACAPSLDSDQPGHLPSLISLHCPHEETFRVLSYPLSGCPVWSESSLGAHSFGGFVMSWLIYPHYGVYKYISVTEINFKRFQSKGKQEISLKRYTAQIK